MGLAFLLSARQLGREHLVAPYREDWKPLREEGFAAYARRVSEPYRDGDHRPLRPRARDVDGAGADTLPPLRILTLFSGSPSNVVRVKRLLVGSGGLRRAGCGGACACVDADAVVRHRLVGASTGCPTPRPATRSTWPTSGRPGAPDRFAELAPRIVGDVAAIDAWWRSQDPTRAPRFDLFPVACATAFGALDITNVELPQPISGIAGAFSEIRLLLARTLGFTEPEKVYLVYYDGPTGQSGLEQVCGQGAERGGGLPGDRDRLSRLLRAHSEGDTLRPVVGVHELVHVFGAVDGAAPNACDRRPRLRRRQRPDDRRRCPARSSRRTCWTAAATTTTATRDPGPTCRTRSSSSGSTRPTGAAPTTPAAPVVRDDPSGLVAFSWRASSDDVGPVAYRVYQDGRFIREVAQTSVLLIPPDGDTGSYSVRARRRGRAPEPARDGPLQAGLGIVDEQGRLLRDTVRPPAIRHDRDPADDRRPPCSRGRPCATPAASAATGSRSARGRSRDEARGDDHARDAAHGRLGRRGRPGRQRRPATTVPLSRLR